MLEIEEFMTSLSIENEWAAQPGSAACGIVSNPGQIQLGPLKSGIQQNLFRVCIGVLYTVERFNTISHLLTDSWYRAPVVVLC